MKKLVVIFATVLLGLMSGCTASAPYDDSQIWSAIDELKVQVANQQTLLIALANNLTITSITETNEGFVVTFSDNTTITIKHGEDGKDGADGEDGQGGSSVIVSVTWDDQNAYFTLSDGSVVTIPLANVGGGNGEVSENNKIYYTSADKAKVFPYQAGHASVDAVMLSNTYENGVGCMIFDDEVTMISGTFRDSYLTSITLPKSMEQIIGRAFANCVYLEEFTIPENVYWLSSAVFDGSTSLKRIYCKPTTPPMLGENPLGAIPDNVKIYVPENSLDDYLASDWSAYASLIIGYDYDNNSSSEEATAGYSSWLGTWRVTGSGLNFEDGQGFVTPTTVEFELTVSEKYTNESYLLNGWGGLALGILSEYDAENEVFYISGGVVAENVEFSSGVVASQILLVGEGSDGLLYNSVNLAYVAHTESGAEVRPIIYTMEDGDELYFTHTVYVAIIDNEMYYLSDYEPSTSLTMVRTTDSSVAAPSNVLAHKEFKVGRKVERLLQSAILTPKGL